MFVPISQHVVADRYELIEEIGRGSMGVIWRARQTNLGIECAIKFIHAAQAHDPELRRRFVREARAAASLKSPHSVHILDVDEWQGCLFIAMELLIGETLEARLERVGRLSPDATLEIVDQVARGLNKAHAARLVHRDLKPDNIFLVDDEPLLVKILDFGIAKRLDAIAGLQTASGALLGTPGYMSPEQALASKNIDYRSDLWSLAVVVFRCLTGVEPFDGDGIGQILVEIVKGPLKKPSVVNPHLPVSLDAWWQRATQREPSDRHESATELVNDLRQALESQPIWPASAFEPTIGGGSDFPDNPPATLEPVLAAQRNSSPAAMRYSVAMVPALIVSGWFIGRALWSPSVGAWRTDRTEQSASPVSFAVAPVTAATLEEPAEVPPETPPSVPTPTAPVDTEAAPPVPAPPAAASDPGAAPPASLKEPTAPGATTPSPVREGTGAAGTAGEATRAAAPPASATAGAGSTVTDGSQPSASAGASGQGAAAKASGEAPSAPDSHPPVRRDPAQRSAGAGGRGGASAGGGGGSSSGGGGASSKSAGARSRSNNGGRNAAPAPPSSPDDRSVLDSLADRDELRPSRDDDFGIDN